MALSFREIERVQTWRYGTIDSQQLVLRDSVCAAYQSCFAPITFALQARVLRTYPRAPTTHSPPG